MGKRSRSVVFTAARIQRLGHGQAAWTATRLHATVSSHGTIPFGVCLASGSSTGKTLRFSVHRALEEGYRIAVLVIHGYEIRSQFRVEG